MACEPLESIDARNKVENLAEVTSWKEAEREAEIGESNPYQALIGACGDRAPHKIQSAYSTHRLRRNAQHRLKLLTPDAEFPGLVIDPFLLRLENPHLAEPGFQDHRHCLVLWARPPEHVLKLACHLQGLLKAASPNLWLMPSYRMHMTTLEISHSQTPSKIASLLARFRPSIPEIVCYPYAGLHHRPRLVKPLISHDLAAVALSFLPAAAADDNEPVLSPPGVPDTDAEYAAMAGGGRESPAVLKREKEHDFYTYHHLRRDLYALVEMSGVKASSRYVVPSAHITLARFLSQDDHNTQERRGAWVRKIDEINEWLQAELWSKTHHDFVGEWCVGQEKGLDCRTGALWYGGGRTVMLGEGF